MSKVDILADPKGRERKVKAFSRVLKELKVDYLVAAQSRDTSLASMVGMHEGVPMSYLHDDGTLTAQSELWKSKSPALIVDGIDDFTLLSKTVQEVNAAGGRMKHGLLNGKPSSEELRKLKTLGLTWHVVT